MQTLAVFFLIKLLPFHHILINLNVLIKCVNLYLFLNESCSRFQLQTSPEYGQGMNPISRLAQIQQAKKEKEPEYALVTERGLPRRREFVMQVFCSLTLHFYNSSVHICKSASYQKCSRKSGVPMYRFLVFLSYSYSA